MPLRERDLLGPVASHFRDLGYETLAEVEIAGRWADLVAVSDGAVVAVELKLRAWREAIRQAMAYQLGADRTYVALPLGRAQEAHRHRFAFEREGVGLLAVEAGGGVRRVLPAGASPRQMPPLAEAVRRRVEAARETVNMLTGDSRFAGATPATEVPQVRLVDHEPAHADARPHPLEAAAELEGIRPG